MEVIIDRLNYSDKQVEGLLTIYDGEEKVFNCWTLELPDLDNQPRISCIPKGEYNVVKRFSPKYKYHFHILEVPNRSYILIHQANFVSQLRGCIAIGKTLKDINNDGLKDVTSSVMTKNKLLKILPNKFTLTIK